MPFLDDQAALSDQSALESTLENVTSKQKLLSNSIRVRKSLFKAEQIERHYAPSPLLSHLLTALSVTFPEGEKFFVETIRNVRHLIDNPLLQADISAFIGQESRHAKSHSEFNQSVLSDNYNIDVFKHMMDAEFIRLRTLSQRRQLAATVVLEHFTAMIAGYMLKYPRLISHLDTNMKNLWLWHAIEEIEHKSVAFDVYKQVFDNKAQLRRSMRTISIGFILGNMRVTSHLLWQDRKNSLGNIRNLAKNFRDLGLLVHMMLVLFPEYISFYFKNFHPTQIDQSALLEKWSLAFEQLNALKAEHV